MEIDRGLLPWATERERELMEAVAAQGVMAAARALGIGDRAIRRSMERLRARAARGGYAPGMLAPGANAPGCRMVKTTVHLDQDGKVVEEWRREVPGAEAMEELVERLCARADGQGPAIPPPRTVRRPDLMLELDCGEIHVGKYSWAKETGHDYDADIAAMDWLGCLGEILEDAGPVGEILLVSKGDFLHADNRVGLTEKSGHVLDMDGRFDRLIDTARDAFLAAVEMAAKRARKVTLRILPGNHDWHASRWLARVLSAWYRRTQQVEVVVASTPRQYHRWGCSLIGYAHGDQVKGRDFPLLMATEAAADWAACPHRHWHLGHIHRSRGIISECSDQHMGATVEYLPSLSAPDAWHAEHGFLGQRRLDAFLWSRERGLIRRFYAYAHQGRARA